MLMRHKNRGATTTVDKGQSPKRGFRGRLELFAERNEEGFSVVCRDVGNYGMTRWQGKFENLDLEDLEQMISDLVALAQGRIQSTEETEEQETTEEVATVNEETAEAVPLPNTESTTVEKTV